MTPECRKSSGNPTAASAVTVAHQLLSSAMRSNNDRDWPVHSLMLSFHDLRGLPLWRPSSMHRSLSYGSRMELISSPIFFSEFPDFVSATSPFTMQGYSNYFFRHLQRQGFVWRFVKEWKLDAHNLQDADLVNSINLMKVVGKKCGLG